MTQRKGQKTFLEQKNAKRNQTLEQERESEIYKNFKDIFSDGELIDVLKED